MKVLGPVLTWALYLLGCQWVAPEVLPFLAWAGIVVALLLIGYQLLVVEQGPAHHDVLYNKACRGHLVEVSRRKLEDRIIVSKQCEVCKTLFEVQEA